jgi:hypothetical protein
MRTSRLFVVAVSELLLLWLSLFVGVSVGQIEGQVVGGGGYRRDKDASLDWTGRRIYFSGYSGNSAFGVLGGRSIAKLSYRDLKSGVEGASHVFKELRKDCAENDRFQLVTFVGPEEFVTQYCGSLYLMNASDLQVKKKVASGRSLALHWTEPTRTLVVSQKGLIVVIDGNKWEQVASWPVPEFRDLIISRDGTLVGLQLRSNPCTLSVRRLPKGEIQAEILVDDCYPPVRFLGGGKGPTAGSVRHTSRGLVLTLWDLQSDNKKLNEVTLEDSANVQIEEEGYFTNVAASPDWKWIMGNQPGHPHQPLAWDPNSGKVIFRTPKPKLPHVWGFRGDPITTLEVSGDGQSVFVNTYWFQTGSVFDVLRPQ